MPDAFEPWPTGTSVTTRTKGLRLHARRYGDGPATVLLLHGLASESRELGALPTVLAEAGYTVLTPDLRGHGRSQGRRGRLDPEAIREDLDAWKAWAANRDAPVRAIGGHSLGGVWALANAPRFKAKAVLALCSPASITHQLNAVEQLAYRAGGGLQKLAQRVGYDHLAVPYKVKPKDVLDDPGARTHMEATGMIQASVPLANVDTLLTLDATRWARACRMPGLYAVATRDRVVDHANTKRLHDAHGLDPTWLELEGPHSIFYGPKGDEPAHEVAAWLEEVVPSRS